MPFNMEAHEAIAKFAGRDLASHPQLHMVSETVVSKVSGESGIPRATIVQVMNAVLPELLREAAKVLPPKPTVGRVGDGY